MTPLTDEQRARAASEEGLALARGLARTYSRSRRGDPEAHEAAALMGLTLAARDFDPARGVKFTTFAAPRVWGAIIDAARELMPKGFKRRGALVTVRSLADPLADEGRPVTLGDTLPADELPVGWELESADAVERITRLGIPRRDGAVLRALFLRAECRLMHQAARRFGVTENRVSQCLKGNALVLAEHMEARGSDTDGRDEPRRDT